MSASFHEIQFPVQISYGCTGGPVYKTTVVRADSGAEQRIGQWVTGRLKWSVSQGVKNAAQLAALIAFFRARKGKLYGFRFKDWTDYQVRRGPLLPAADGSALQLYAGYSDAAGTEMRKIAKPVAGKTETWPQVGIAIYPAAGGAALTSGYSADYTTGIVTGLGSAAGSYVWSGEFDVPARFDTDEMRVNREGFAINNWDDIAVLEILQ